MIQRQDLSVVLVSKHRDLAMWLSDSLEGTATVVPCQQTDLNDVLQLLSMSNASILFMPIERDRWQEDVRLVESIMAARPTLAVVVLSDSQDQDRVLASMRAGAKDFLTYGARASDLSGLVRRLAERTPAVVSSPVQQGLMVTMASERPVTDAAFHIVHVAAAIKAAQRDAHVLVIDLGQPYGEAQQIFGLEGQFSFMDALRNLRRLDSSLVETAFPRHKSGVKVLSATADGVPLMEVTTSEVYLLMGALRSLFTHVLVNVTGLPLLDFTELLIGNANHVLFPIDQSISSCRAGLDLMTRLRELGVPISEPMLLVDHYHPRVSPDLKAISRSFSLDRYLELPSSMELRLRCMNLGQLTYELGPNDPLSKHYRSLAQMILMGKDAQRVTSAQTQKTSVPWLERLTRSVKG